MSSITDHYVSFDQHLTSTEFPNGKKVCALRQPKIHVQREVLITTLPSTAINTAAFFGSQFDFRIERTVSRVKCVWLKLTVSSAAGATFCIPQGFIKEYDILVEGKTAFSQISPQECYVSDNIALSLQEFETGSTLVGQDETYSKTQITLAAGETREFMIPVAPSLFNAIAFRPYMLRDHILIRFRTEPTASCVSAGTVTVSGELRILGVEENENQKRDMLSKMSLPIHNYFYSQQYHPETIPSLGASQTVNIRLSGISGKAVNFLTFMIIPTASISDPATKLTGTAIASYEIQDSASNSLTGYNPITAAESVTMYSRLFNNKFHKYNNAYTYSFSPNPTYDELTGQCSGFHAFTGFEQLRITTLSTHTPGSYYVQVFASCSETMVTQNGHVSVSRQ